MLAHHYTEAGLTEPAIHYWQQAGERAKERSAYVEAVAHLTQSLTLLSTFPDTSEYLQRELDIQVALGPALMAIKGQAAPEVERAYARAGELCQQLGDTPQLFPVLRGLIMYHHARGQLGTAYRLGEQLLHLAQSQHESELLLVAHYSLGFVLFLQGEPTSAFTHHTQALTIYTQQAYRSQTARYGVDLGVASHSYAAWELWQLGYAEQSLQHSREALTLAQTVSHAYSLAFALLYAAFLHQFRCDPPAVQEQTAALTTLAREQGFKLWEARGTILQGWALTAQGQGEAGMSQMRQGLAADLATGAKAWHPYFLSMLAEAYEAGGQPEAGLNALIEAQAVMDTIEVRFYEAELHRLKGVLLLKQSVSDASLAETCFHETLDVARRQQGKFWELRAAMSLARLWQSQGKCQDAHDVLAPVYDWFTEGFDTADLQEANALLNELDA